MIKQYGNPLFLNDSWASFSKDDKYRYKLARYINENHSYIQLNPLKTVLWIMLNPSTANAFVLDPTLKKCREFSKREGYEYMFVGNIFAYRSTNPKELYKIKDPKGEENYYAIRNMIESHYNPDIICGWGSEKIIDKYKKWIYSLLYPYKDKLYCLGTNQNGSPKHPLYLPYTTKLRKFKL